MMYMLIDVCYEHSVPFLGEAMECFGPLSEKGLDLSVVACCVVALWFGDLKYLKTVRLPSLICSSLL
jgi:hypothetical protein